MDELVRQPVVISKLLNRELDPMVAKIAEGLGLKVFPSSWKDLHMSCSCPDWAVPCKHLAAVIYVVCQEIDNNPFLVFQLHGVDFLEELKKRNIVIDKSRTIEVPAFSSLLQPAKETVEGHPVFHRIDFSGITDISKVIQGILPDEPAFYGEGNFKARFATMMTKVMRNGKYLKNGHTSLAEHTDTPVFLTLTPHAEIAIQITPKGDYSVIVKDGGTKEKVALESLTVALSQIPDEELEYYHPSVQALHQTLLCALNLMGAGAITPQIFNLDKSDFMICWMAARIDKEVDHVVQQLNGLFPSSTVCIKDKTGCYEVVNQADVALSNMLNMLIGHTSGGQLNFYDKCLRLFFAGSRCKFEDLGEKEVPGGIKAWLDHLYITNHRYCPVFIVDEMEPGKSFGMCISVEDRENQPSEKIPLKDILENKEYENCRFEILKEISLLDSLVDGISDYVNGQAKHNITFDVKTFTPFLLHTIPAIRLIGIKVLLPSSMKDILRPKPTVSISRKNARGESFLRIDQLLTFNWQIALGDECCSPETFDELRKHAGGLMYYKQHYIYVDESDIKQIEKALSSTKQFTAAQLMQMALSEDMDSAPIQLTNEARQLIKQFTEWEKAPVPAEINATLRPYQERGFSWMYRNMQLGFGSIIADDMGLGKTLQVITLIQKVKNDGLLKKRKVLIVVPTGLLTNWQAELCRFAPSLTYFLYHGPNRSLKDFDADILLTSYGIFRSDADKFNKLKWAVAVIDEAQNIKNSDTAQSKAVRSITADVHIAMSGTPVENRLSEYWSIMDFANKGYLGALKKFNDDYARPIQSTGDKRLVEKFKKITAPFMMRRLKTDKRIISDLPDKIEQDEFALLTPSQAALYEQTVNEAMTVIEGMEDEENKMFKRAGLILQMMMALKQICNHPAQFLKDGNTDAALSGKVQMLQSLVDSIHSAGEKAIIFTQFKEMGDLLTHFIKDTTGTQPMFLHGGCSIKQRQEMIKRFQEGNADRFFILSLKAAGTGLNLTAASQVIHFDLWWNPAVESQATDRAYRIGQQKNVMVHRFITKNTFEEKINEMIQHKKALADMTVSTGENWIGKLSDTELESIFRLTD